MKRRTFLKASALAAAGAYASAKVPLWAAPSGPVTTPLNTFDYSAVGLADGPLKRQFDENHSLFMGLDDDRLLKVFRQKAGLPAPGADMGGWYDLDGFDLATNNFHGFVPGHTLGQYMSGLSRAYAVNGSAETRAKVQRLVKGYAETLDAKASFLEGYRLPAYTYDKLAVGLMDAHAFAKDPTAMEVHEKLTRGALAHLPEKALSRAEQRARPHKDESYAWDEPYTLPENLFLAYQRSGKDFYRDLGARFLEDDTYFGPLAEGENPMVDEHAYSHVNAFSSAMQAYLTLGSQKHLLAAKNGFSLLQAQSYATGGWGPNEGLIALNKGLLGESLAKTHASFETPCGAYAHFKITRYLLRVTKDSRYGDSMERVLYNTILGAKPIQPDGTSFYYSDYGTPGKKGYHRDKWPCCSGTFPQLAADYHISVYLRSADGVYVNLFVPSTLRWETQGAKLELTQRTNYPFDNRVQIRVTTSRPVQQTISLRIPAWAGETTLNLNGKSARVEAGSFAQLRRIWEDGDQVEMELPMPTRLEPVDAQRPDLVALMHGPLVLFAIGDRRPSLARADLLRAKATKVRGEWTAKAADGTDVTLRPFMSIQDETYSTYQQLKS